MRPVRHCARCGVAFSKPGKLSWRQWLEGYRFCSKTCRFVSTMPLCACGCDQHVASRECRYVGGHRPRTRNIAPNGYIRLWAPEHPLAGPDGNVLEHRRVVFDAGIPVPPGHHVHHRNGDKTDNRLENLEVLPAAEHHRGHVREAGFVINQYGVWPVSQ